MSAILPVTLNDVTIKRRGKDVLGPISLQLTDPSTTIILGPNGAGKTSLLRAMHGIERLTSGDVGWQLPEREARAHQAFVFQTPIMLRRSVRENLSYPLALTGRSGDVENWASRIGLGDALDRPAPRLSGGEKQKLALARALIMEPDVLFLDEPCANLDGRSTREIEAILFEAKASGTKIIMATHDLGQARRLANEVIFLLNGQLHQHRAAQAFFDEPDTAQTRAFLKGDIVE